MESLRLMTFNARGLGDKYKRRTVFCWLKKYYAKHIILLQETHTTINTEQLWIKDWNGPIYFSHGTSGSKGVATLLPTKFDRTQILNTFSDSEGRLLSITLCCDDTKYLVINLYAPTKDHPDKQQTFIESINTFLKEQSGLKILIGGDLNIILNPDIDKKGGRKEPQTKNAKKLIEICENNNLVDVWRILNPEINRYSRRENTRAGIVHSRLDLWLIPSELMNNIIHADINVGCKSDHSAVILEFYLSETQRRGRGFWKFNATLLQNKEYVDTIKNCITDSLNNYESLENKGLVWDLVKCDIRGLTVSFSSHLRKTRDKHEEDLSKELNELEQQLDVGGNADIKERYASVQREFESIQAEKAQGAVLRSKANLIEYDEKNTKFFLDLEKTNYEKKHIKTLVTDTGTIHDPSKVLDEEKRFYKALYTEPLHNRPDDAFFLEGLPQLDEEQKALIERDLTLEECSKALKSLANKKSPGSDGFTTDFYKFFWPDIKNIVFASIKYAFQANELSIDQKRGVIVLVPKKGKDSRLLKNWRPISLLNTDYKILAKILADRLQKIIAKLVHSDQNGYIRGRYIGYNIRVLTDILEYSDKYKLEGLLAFLDFEKAFDSLNWSFLFKVLHEFNLGTNYIKWVKILYSDIESCVTNNGHASAFFKLERGIRQGCPLSALLFVLVVETLAVKIRNSDNIIGIKVGDYTIKLSLLADDTTLVLRDEVSLQNALMLIEKFKLYAGLALNRDKTEAIWIGASKNRVDTPCNLKWSKDPVKALGIWFSTDQNKMLEVNTAERIKKLQTVLNIWSQHNLSLKGRITVIKTLALSQILYVTSVMYTSEEVVTQVQNIITKFLWAGKPPKIKAGAIMCDIEEGGLKMPHVNSIIKTNRINWVKRACQQVHDAWSAILKTLLKSEDLLTWFKFKLTKQFIPKTLPLFYQQMLEAWYQLYVTEPTTVEEISKESLWNNYVILIEQKPINFSHWQVHNIMHIADLLDNHNNFLSFNQFRSKTGINNFMEYFGVLAAIPYNWKQKVKQSQTKQIIDPILSIAIKLKKKQVELEHIKNIDIYNHFTRTYKETPTAVYRWTELYDIDPDDWPQIFTTPFRVCRETSLQSLQYKILHRIYPCNTYLSKWNSDISESCIFCPSVDTLAHHFFTCETSKYLWASLTRLWQNSIGVGIVLSEIDIILGCPNENNDDTINALNFCIIFGKWYIAKCKLEKKKCNFIEFVRLLKKRLATEEYICNIQSQQTIFQDRFSLLLENM